MKIGDRLRASDDWPMYNMEPVRYYVQKNHIYHVVDIKDDMFYIKSDYQERHGCAFSFFDKYFCKSLVFLNKNIKII